MANKVARASSRTKSFWIDHISRWRHSDLSKAEYCRQQGLNAGSFYNWCSVESAGGGDRELGTTPSKPMRLLPVKVVEPATEPGIGFCGPSAPMVLLEHASGRFGFPTNLPAETIERWLKAIGQARVGS